MVRLRIMLTKYEERRYVPLPGYGMRFSVLDQAELPAIWVAVEDAIEKKIAELRAAKASAAEGDKTTGG